jgi:CRISPR-associated protein Cmr2
MPSTQYLFLFTIGPVQSFIAQARKTHDLFAGSQIISELTGKSMEAVLQQGNGNSIVFPCTDSWSKPNRFLAKVFSDDIQGFGKNVEVAARTRWVQLALESFQSADQSLDLQIIDETLILNYSQETKKRAQKIS